MRTRGALALTLLGICAALFAGAVSAPASTGAGSLAIEVTDNVGGIAQYASTVTFTHLVRNTGDETITAIAVDDSLAGHLGDIDALAPGESRSFSAQVVIAGAATGGVGTCTAAGQSPTGPVSVTRDYAVDVFLADNISDYAIGVRAIDDEVRAGGVIRYRITVRVQDPGIPTRVRVIDDYDERALSVLDADGGRVSRGRVVLDVPDDISASRPFIAICTFQVRPTARGAIVNEASLDTEEPDPNPANDSSTAVVRVQVAVVEREQSASIAQAGGSSSRRAGGQQIGDDGEPFLPFTGGPEQLVPLVWLLGMAGYALRRAAAA